MMICSKIYHSYKRYVLHEHNNKHVTLNIYLSDVTGRYYSFNDDNKSINFILNDDLFEKFYEIFCGMEVKLGTGINDFTLTNSHGTSLKTKVKKDRTCFRQNNKEIENVLPRQNTNYICRILIRLESVFFNNNKNNKDDIIYCSQVFLEECRYTSMNNRRLLLDNIDLSDNELEIETKSKEECNENTVQ